MYARDAGHIEQISEITNGSIPAFVRSAKKSRRNGQDAETNGFVTRDVRRLKVNFRSIISNRRTTPPNRL